MRVAAFLRAVNVGGRIVPMARLKAVFESVGCRHVRTVIASGNVVFDAASSDIAALEASIEAAVQESLGWGADTFVRSGPELQAVVDSPPFTRAEIEAAGSTNVAFLRSPPNAEAQALLMARESPIDRFAVQGREVYWLCKTKQSESDFSGAVLEQTLGMRATLRGLATVERVLREIDRSLS